MKESSFVTNVIRKSSEKTMTLFQTHVVNFSFGWNPTASCHDLKTSRLETVLLHDGNGLHFGLDSLHNYPVWICLLGGGKTKQK
jgi:hypothetical protein